ncbi:unnamed protein product [Victoria cruziana]
MGCLCDRVGCFDSVANRLFWGCNYLRSYIFTPFEQAIIGNGGTLPISLLAIVVELSSFILLKSASEQLLKKTWVGSSSDSRFFPSYL